MSYYAPFYQPLNYAPNMLSGIQGYNNQLQGLSQQNVAQMPQSDTAMIWVLGKNEAESYPVAPNCQVVLWDKNAPTLYVKSMNANGVPNMRTLDFTERTETASNSPVKAPNDLGSKFVAIEDFNALKLEFNEFKSKYNELEHNSKTTIKKKGSEE